MPIEKNNLGLQHLNHLEDNIFADRETLKNYISGIVSLLEDAAEDNDYVLQLKVDGAPAVFVGKIDNEIFIAKKSIFNKIPEIYKSASDIKEKTEGDLRKKLLVLFDEIKNIPPSKIPSGVLFHGDFMYTEDDIAIEKINGDKYITFQPNALEYAVPIDTTTGRKILKSTCGVIFHRSYSFDLVEYEDGSLLPGNFSQNPKSISDTNSFVNTLNRSTKGKIFALNSNLIKITDYLEIPEEKINKLKKVTSKILSKIENIDKKFSKIDNFVEKYFKDLLSPYLNISAINSKKMTIDSFKGFVKEKIQKKINRLRTDKSKQKYYDEIEDIEKTINEKSKLFESIFNVYEEIISYKDLLLDIFKDINYNNFLVFKIHKDFGREPTEHEGIVFGDSDLKKLVKIINRAEFSKINFSKDYKMGFEKDKYLNVASISYGFAPLKIKKESVEADKVAAITFGRFSPPHAEHQKLIDIVESQKADGFFVATSQTFDNKKNFLEYQIKVKVLKEMASPKTEVLSFKTFFDFIKHVYELGYNKLIAVFGDDRDIFKDLLLKYNCDGKTGYCFKNIDIVIKPRKTSGLDVAGISATAMRQFAKDGNYEMFRQGLSHKVSEDTAKMVFEVLHDRVNYPTAKDR